VQLFEHIEEIASKKSPGKQMKAYDPIRVANETAEEQAVGLQNHYNVDGLMKSPHKKGTNRARFYVPDLDSEGSATALSTALRQASIASCASEWVDTRQQLARERNPK
jgi:hypothetical protein